MHVVLLSNSYQLIPTMLSAEACFSSVINQRLQSMRQEKGRGGSDWGSRRVGFSCFWNLWVHSQENNNARTAM